MKDKPRTPGAPVGNQNAAKPEEDKRVGLTCMVDPDTRKRIEELKKVHGSIGQVIDYLVQKEAEDALNT